jgi:hypothetical protein
LFISRWLTSGNSWEEEEAVAFGQRQLMVRPAGVHGMLTKNCFCYIIFMKNKNNSVQQFDYSILNVTVVL